MNEAYSPERLKALIGLILVKSLEQVVSNLLDNAGACSRRIYPSHVVATVRLGFSATPSDS